jgi:hypothetical protein
VFKTYVGGLQLKETNQDRCSPLTCQAKVFNHERGRSKEGEENQRITITLWQIIYIGTDSCLIQ